MKDVQYQALLDELLKIAEGSPAGQLFNSEKAAPEKGNSNKGAESTAEPGERDPGLYPDPSL